MASTMMLRVDEIAELFDDVTPLPQDDGPEPVCVIQYPAAFVIAHDYMRACWKSGEKSDRSLRLSATCLKLNPANYTVWHYRRVCMDALGYFEAETSNDEGALDKAREMIRADLILAAQLGGSNPKNYQIWYHRRALLEAYDIMSRKFHDNKNDDDSSPTPSSPTLESEFLDSERSYIAGVLDEDSKNYHAWSHRQWLIRTIHQPYVWKEEMEYAEQLIKDDPRNNSAWNQRWFAAHQALRQPLPLEVCHQEATFALECGAKIDPYNESPFRYLIGILKEQQGTTKLATLAAEYYPKVEALKEVLEEAQRDADSCVNWTSARIDLLEAMGDMASLTQAVALAEAMADRYDTIRTKYWKLRRKQLQNKILALG